MLGNKLAKAYHIQDPIKKAGISVQLDLNKDGYTLDKVILLPALGISHKSIKYFTQEEAPQNLERGWISRKPKKYNKFQITQYTSYFSRF